MLEQLPKIIVDIFLAHGIIYKFDKNHAIFIEGETAEFIFLVQKGRVAVSKETASGKELTLRISSKNDCIGENILFTPLISYPTSAKTLEATSVLVLPRKKLEQYLQQEPTSFTACIQWLQIQSMREQSKLRDLLLHGKKGALFSTIIRLVNTYGIQQEDNTFFIPQKFTNTELANLCGTSREVINRLLQDLKKQQIISENQGQLTVHDLEFLKQACECDNCPIFICRIN